MELWWIDCPSTGRLAVAPRPRGGDWLDDDIKAIRLAGIDVLASALTEPEEQELGLLEERQLADDAGLTFVTLPVGDFGVPLLASVAAPLSRLIDDLRNGRNVAVHCRMGVGRSPLFAACMLVGLGVSPDEAWSRVQAARGLQVPDPESRRAWAGTWREWLQRGQVNHSER